jgi:hypothetical protein
MESHLDRVDRSLEELTKKVQKHTLKTPDIINPTSDKTDKTSKPGFQWKMLLKPPYIFMIVLPIIFIILLVYFKPFLLMETDPKDPLKEKKYLSIQKVLLWSIVLSCISGSCIYYFVYMKKNNTPEQTSIKND